MTPLRWVEVDLSAVAANARAVRAALGSGVKFSAVVKADAYGHGAAAVSKTALKNGADALAVTYLEEALDVRAAGVRAPLLVMGPVDPAAAALTAAKRLAVMLDGPVLLKALSRAGRRRPVPVHVKVDLGLRRWGLPLKDLPAFLRLARKTPGVRVEGVFAHPGYMIGKNSSRIEEELQNFAAVAEPFRRADPALEIHAADSAVMLDFPEYRFSRVRVGNLLYGINPTDKPLPLKNPWKAFSRIVHVRRLSVGEMVGYGGEFVASHAMTVGTVPAGYAHGLTLEPASRWIQLKSGQNYWGTVRGVKCPFVGRVGMSHCLVDLTALPSPRVGDAIQLPLRRTASSNWEKFHTS